jgi:Peptidase family M50
VRVLRSIFASIFAISAISCTLIVIAAAGGVFRPEDPASAKELVLRVLGWMLFAAFALINAMACWAHFTRKPSERVWGISAMATLLIAVLIPGVAIHFSNQKQLFSPGFTDAGLGLALLVGGVFAYGRKIEAPPAAQVEQEVRAAPGDGTLKLVNQLFGLVVAAISYAAYMWWLKWTWDYEIPRPAGGLVGITLWLMLIGLVMTLVHEVGHTVVGVALGMKLRVFYAGPFRWKNSGGRWEFKFAPKEILLSGGATGVVPAKAGFEMWRDVAMTVAGPLANLVAATAAFCVACILDWNSGSIGPGLLFLFSAFSAAAFVWNLIPARMGPLFTDGAKIYQNLAGGPWADFNRAHSLVVSSLVTPVRPRDYEMDTIERAAATIVSGPQGLLLRFWACHHWIDRGEITKAVAALKDAERVCLESVANLPAGLHTVFVVENAILLRDSEAVRRWWERMEAKKPMHFNVDYWMARTAASWMAGDLAQAREALASADAEASKLPKAGAYEFDRSRCGHLREAMITTVAQ